MKKVLKTLLTCIMIVLSFLTVSIKTYADSDLKKTEFIHNHSEILQSLNECNKCWKKNGDIRIDYLEQIIHHNEIEICLCENVIKYTDEKEVRSLAKSFIKSAMECNSEVNEVLDEIKKSPDIDKDSESRYAEEYDKKYKNMLLQLQLRRDDDNINKIFLCSSKKHHECMKDICAIVKQYSDDEKINKLSCDISKRLEKEIKKLNRTYKHV